MYRPTEVTGMYSPLPEAMDVRVDPAWKKSHQQDIDEDVETLRQETQEKPGSRSEHNAAQQLNHLFVVSPLQVLPIRGLESAYDHNANALSLENHQDWRHELYQPDVLSGSYDYYSGSDDAEPLDSEEIWNHHSTQSTESPHGRISHAAGMNGNGTGTAGAKAIEEISMSRNAQSSATAATASTFARPAIALIPGAQSQHSASASTASVSSTSSADSKEKYRSMIPPQYMDTKSEAPTRVLVFGWGQQSFMRALLRELDAALKDGSQVTFANLHDKVDTLDPATREAKLKHIKTAHYSFDPLKGNDYQKLGLGGYDAAIVLVDEKWVDPDEDDTNGVDPMARQDVLRLDSMAMMVQVRLHMCSTPYEACFLLFPCFFSYVYDDMMVMVVYDGIDRMR